MGYNQQENRDTSAKLPWKLRRPETRLAFSQTPARGGQSPATVGMRGAALPTLGHGGGDWIVDETGAIARLR